MKKIILSVLLVSTLFSCSSNNYTSAANDDLIIGKWKIIEWGTIVNNVETPSTGIQLNPNKLTYYIFNNDKSYVSEIHFLEFDFTSQQNIEHGQRIIGNYSITGTNLILLGISTPLYGNPDNNPSNHNEDVRIITLDNSNLKIYSNENNNFYYKLIKV
jgi:hypothetical protein